MKIKTMFSGLIVMAALSGCLTISIVYTVPSDQIVYEHYLAQHVDFHAEKMVSGITDTFELGDRIYMLSVAKWDPEFKGGNHDVKWEWYSDGKLLYTHGQTNYMYKPPYKFWRRKSGIDFGKGEHSVVLYIDGQKEKELHFTVR